MYMNMNPILSVYMGLQKLFAMMDKCKTAKEKQELGTTIKQLQQSIDSLKVSIYSIRLLAVLTPFDHFLLIQLSFTANIMPET